MVKRKIKFQGEVGSRRKEIRETIPEDEVEIVEQEDDFDTRNREERSYRSYNTNSVDTRDVFDREITQMPEIPRTSRSEKQTREMESTSQTVNSNVINSNLIRRVENIITDRVDAGMIGVFGINSDVAIKQTLSSRVMQNKCIFLGKIDMFNPEIYDCIAATLWKCIEDRMFEMDAWQKRSLYERLELICSKQEDDFSYMSAFQRLHRISRDSNRDKELVKLIEEIKFILDRSNEKRFVIVIQLQVEDFNYNRLNLINKILSPNILFIVNCLAPYEMVKMAVNGSVGSYEVDSSVIDKFFRPVNTFVAS